MPPGTATRALPDPRHDRDLYLQTVEILDAYTDGEDPRRAYEAMMDAIDRWLRRVAGLPAAEAPPSGEHAQPPPR